MTNSKSTSETRFWDFNRSKGPRFSTASKPTKMSKFPEIVRICVIFKEIYHIFNEQNPFSPQIVWNLFVHKSAVFGDSLYTLI